MRSFAFGTDGLCAFGLLEALARVGLPFTFKGGTCLMLLLEYPQRLSTDIDIVVEPGTDIDKFIRASSGIFPFKVSEEQVRVGKNNIVKRHFKFTYDGLRADKETYILLDVLFESNHYVHRQEVPIANELPCPRNRFQGRRGGIAVSWFGDRAGRRPS